MDLEVCGRKWSWPYLRYQPGICLEGQEKRKGSWDIKGPSGDLNPVSADIYLLDWDVLCDVLYFVCARRQVRISVRKLGFSVLFKF
jgi:hypothetical protein